MSVAAAYAWDEPDDLCRSPPVLAQQQLELNFVAHLFPSEHADLTDTAIQGGQHHARATAKVADLM